MTTLKNKSKGNTVIGFLASSIVFAMLIGGVVFFFNYFNSARHDILALDVRIQTLNEGVGTGARQGDRVTVNYIATLEDGTEYDNSYKRGEPFVVIIGERRVIPGWEKGLLGIKKGEKRKLVIPPGLAYGSLGLADPTGTLPYLVPPDTSIYLTVEAVEINTHGFLR